MMNSSLILISSAVAILGMIVYSRGLSFVLMFISYSFAVFLGVIIGFRYVFTRGRKYQPSLKKREENALLRLLMEKQQNSSSPVKKQHVIVTRSVDAALEEIVDLITRDYIMYWLNDLISSPQKLSDMIKEDAWIVIQNAHDTLGKIDQVKFLTNDVTNKICQHYQKIRLASVGGDGKEAKPLFLLRAYLQSQETELEFLRKVSEALLVLLLPRSYNQFEPVRHLLREILACSVLFPAIELICDPDYINQKLLSYILYHQEMLERHKRTYAVAATYEDFIKMLNECTDIEQLKRMRYKIMSEIMQATTSKNLKKAKGMDVDKEFMPQGGHKGDFLQARNLKRYINQLTMAKTQCEKKIKGLGGPDFTSPLSPTSDISEEIPNIPGKRVLSLQVILDSPHARRYFMKFLEKENAQALLGCWELLEEMRLADKKNIHQIGNEIHKTYIANASSIVKLDKSILKGMEAFLVGDKGPEAFLSAQEAIVHNLEERHYPCFIVSDVYHKMLKEADELGIDFLNEPLDETDGSSFEISSECSSDGSIPLCDHSSYAKSKLQQLDERLNNKIQALKGMKAAQNLDSKVTMKLEKEVESMKQERGQLEYHIERTEVWSENLGSWRVHIQNSKVESEKDKSYPSFTLAVHKQGETVTEFDEQTPMRWNVNKKLNDFVDLHRKLIQIGPWLKSAELPKESKILFKHYDKPYLEKAKGLIQNYMSLVLEDDQLNKNENLYTFLSPNPEFLKQPLPSPKKTKFFFANFFKGQNSGPKEGSDDEEFLFLDDEIGPMKDDPIAEPLYALIGEIFDMRGVFKLLRRTLITFVQITYGRTINRQLRDTVSWIFSEPMILHYIHLFQDAMWPNGVLAKPGPIRDDETKMQTRHQAKQLFLNSIPELLSDFVGQQNARKGALKVFESLQDVRLNKQLLYELFELFLQEIFADYKDQNS